MSRNRNRRDSSIDLEPPIAAELEYEWIQFPSWVKCGERLLNLSTVVQAYRQPSQTFGQPEETVLVLVGGAPMVIRGEDGAKLWNFLESKL